MSSRTPEGNDYGPVGRAAELGAEEAASERPHLQVHVVASRGKPIIPAPSQVPPSRKSANQQRVGRKGA